ncbi:unnamed protein product [Allacma fusca]|uniref:ABC transporter domain-containing protein n=1 Tax=Allacma fusca TaxID=39272 RepID=A0A8J2PJT6_9HEXA|nr:unnamed protein product [Allacma fusca]
MAPPILHPTKSVKLEFRNLNFLVNDASSALDRVRGTTKKRSILKDVSGVIEPGKLTAIMGPSGAGKSTLMNILAGYKTENVTGEILLNGAPRNNAKFRKMSCYIMQDDVLLLNLTVIEAMRFAAQLKLPLSKSRVEKERIIQDTLEMIGLTGCQGVMTSNISGGQRKRLAIAFELINNPPVMFFDEPTSGLDSATCYSCVNLLKALATGGRTIIATIHQPSARIFELFDSLYLLSCGYSLYRGPINSLVPFFAKEGIQCPPYHNPADFAIEVASGDYGEHWIPKLAKTNDMNANSIQAAEVDVQSINKSPESPKAVNGVQNESFTVSITSSFEDSDDSSDSSSQDGKVSIYLNQFTTLFKRSFVCVSRDMMLTHLRFAASVLVGLFVGAIYHDVGNDASKCFDNAGNLFFGLLFLVFSSMMCTLLTFPLERGVLIREHMNCWYSLKSYFLARTLADLPFQMFFPLLYIVIAYFMTEQPYDMFRLSIVIFFAILISLTAQSIGLLIGAACSLQSAVFIGPITAIPVFLFSGFFVTMKSVPAYIRWIAYVSYARYSFQSLLTAMYGFDRAPLKCGEPYCHFKNPRKFLEALNADDISVVDHAICMVVILVVCRFGSYMALRVKIMSERN